MHVLFVHADHSIVYVTKLVAWLVNADIKLQVYLVKWDQFTFVDHRECSVELVCCSNYFLGRRDARPCACARASECCTWEIRPAGIRAAHSDRVDGYRVESVPGWPRLFPAYTDKVIRMHAWLSLEARVTVSRQESNGWRRKRVYRTVFLCWVSH